MNLMRITSNGLCPRIAFFTCLWVMYGGYYYLINVLNGSGITVLEVVFSLPVFAILAHGVYIIFSKLLSRRRVLVGIVCLFTLYVAVSWLTNGLANLVNGWLEKPMNGGEPIDYLDGAFLANTATIIGNYSLFGVAAFFMDSAIRNAKLKQSEAEARLDEAEKRLLAERDKKRFEFFMLAGQVSPHFIANLLSSWRDKLKHTQLTIATSMGRAYDLMVYYMEARNLAKRRVPLAVELERLENYVALTTGSGSTKYIQCNYRGELDGYTIPPTSLLDLLENSTKHGRADLPESPIRMEVTVADNQLRCVCTNVVNGRSDRESHGVGLANLKRRLELEYNDRYSLETQRQRNLYIAQLIINYL